MTWGNERLLVGYGKKTDFAGMQNTQGKRGKKTTEKDCRKVLAEIPRGRASRVACLGGNETASEGKG